MRSRYSAFALGLADYLQASWHPDTRPAEPALPEGCKWIRLEILGRTAGGPGDRDGTVTFAAWYTQGGRAQVLREHSQFEQVDGRWLYREGTAP